MKTYRTIFTILLSLMLIFSITPISKAATNIVDCPDIKVFLDSQPITLSDEIISVNNSTLLPLRALLVSLGVQNDNDHIVWNGNDKSVTIYKDSIKIFLKQGSTTAYVNDEEVKLNAAPLGYEKNNRTYIPIRFVAEALGYKVGWDGHLRCIYISSMESYNQVKEIIEKSISVMASYNKYSCNYSFYNADGIGSYKSVNTINLLTKIDKNNGIKYSKFIADFGGTKFDTESFLTKAHEYTRDNHNGPGWEIKDTTETSFNEELKLLAVNHDINFDENTFTELVIDQETDENQIVIKGYAFPVNWTPKDDLATNKEYKKDGFCAIYIDRASFAIKKIIMYYDAISVNNPDKFESLAHEYQYGDFDGDFELILPKVE